MSQILDSRRIREAYLTTNRRIFFLDYDGTLVAFRDSPGDSSMEKHTRSMLHQLLADPGNQIYIISGRTREFLDNQFREYTVGLIAEHGFLLKRVNRKWLMPHRIETQWKVPLTVSFRQLTKLYPGTFFEEKESSVAFHYRTAGSDVGGNIRNDILRLFIPLHVSFPSLELLDGNYVIEIKPKEFNKGQIAEMVLSSGRFDFILAAGDDKTDEFLFQKLNPKAFTIKIGIDPTTANYHISTREEFIEFLFDLSTTKFNGNP
jgi:trehalose 6-phosphate synthase/phosphatase